MDKEKLESRIQLLRDEALKVKTEVETLEANKNQMIANVNAIHGAIQDCTYWLEQLTNHDPEGDGDVNGVNESQE